LTTSGCSPPPLWVVAKFAPFIRQLGVFVGAGLICALAAAVVYFSTVMLTLDQIVER
jgi:hypothetical protein